MLALTIDEYDEILCYGIAFYKSGASSNENPIVYHSPVVRNHILYKARKSNEVFIKLHIKSIKYTKTTLFEIVSFFAFLN